MNILSLFVLVPLLMLLGLWIARNLNQVRGVMVAGHRFLYRTPQRRRYRRNAFH